MSPFCSRIPVDVWRASTPAPSRGWQVAHETVLSPESAVWWYRISPSSALRLSTFKASGIGHTGSLANSSAIPDFAFSCLRSTEIQSAMAARSWEFIFENQWTSLNLRGGIVFSSTTYSIFARADSFAGKPCSIAFIVGAMSKLRNPRAISFLIRDPTSGMYP